MPVETTSEDLVNALLPSVYRYDSGWGSAGEPSPVHAGAPQPGEAMSIPALDAVVRRIVADELSRFARLWRREGWARECRAAEHFAAVQASGAWLEGAEESEQAIAGDFAASEALNGVAEALQQRACLLIYGSGRR